MRDSHSAKTAFSCFVDSHPRFEFHAVLWAWSLIRLGSVAAESIFVHTAPGTSPEFIGVMQDFGVNVCASERFHPGHPHCNKIMQTETDFGDHEQVVLCDCDVMAARPLDIDIGSDSVAGRPVDRPNPALQDLIRLYTNAGVSVPASVPVGLPKSREEETLFTNWNGGLYVIRSSELSSLGRSWKKHALSLIEHETENLGAARIHIDQISFGIALCELELPCRHLERSYNVPLHLGPAGDLATDAVTSATIVHHHGNQDSLGFLIPIGDPVIDSSLSRINSALKELLSNRVLSDRNFSAVHASWQGSAESTSAEDLDAAERAFCNPRYTRHTARRLEHLASLRLPMENRSVLELGAGIGQHSQFFLDRDCTVVSVEPRPENCGYLRTSQSAERKPTVLRATADEAVDLLEGKRFQIVYNYGLLYHLKDPVELLVKSAALCTDLYLLETAVSDLQRQESLVYVEDDEDPTNAVDGHCTLLSRTEILEALRQVLPFAYVPRTQPSHEQFLRDWTDGQMRPLNRHRAIFVGSTAPLCSKMFSEEALDVYEAG